MAQAGAAAARAHAARHARQNREERATEALDAAGEMITIGPKPVRKKKEKKEKEPEVPATGIWKYQKAAKTFYDHLYVQLFVASLICGNFLQNLIEKTVDPSGLEYEHIFSKFELFFNIAFAIELVINMYGSWCRVFWSSSWNVFDFVVVSIGLLTTANVPLPGPFTMLRMMRAFRVFRLFKRVESLRKIMEALARAIPGVINAFVILLIVMCIYAILGVEFFRTYGVGGFYLNEAGKEVALITPRGSEYGEEYFGNFPKSLYTMFQVLTGESWSEAVARPLLHGPDVMSSVGVGIYFVSFIVINGIILINVVVAVLLDKFVQEDAAEPEEEESEEEWEEEEGGDQDAADKQQGQDGSEKEKKGNEEDTDESALRTASSKMVHEPKKVTIGEAVKQVTVEVEGMKDQLAHVLVQLEKKYAIAGLKTADGPGGAPIPAEDVEAVSL